MGVSRHTYGRVVAQRRARHSGSGVALSGGGRCGSVSARFVIVAIQRYRISELTIMVWQQYGCVAGTGDPAVDRHEQARVGG